MNNRNEGILRKVGVAAVLAGLGLTGLVVLNKNQERLTTDFNRAIASPEARPTPYNGFVVSEGPVYVYSGEQGLEGLCDCNALILRLREWNGQRPILAMSHFGFNRGLERYGKREPDLTYVDSMLGRILEQRPGAVAADVEAIIVGGDTNYSERWLEKKLDNEGVIIAAKYHDGLMATSDDCPPSSSKSALAMPYGLVYVQQGVNGRIERLKFKK